MYMYHLRLFLQLTIEKNRDDIGVGSVDNIFLATSSSSVPQNKLPNPNISERRVSAPVIKYPTSHPTYSNFTSCTIAMPLVGDSIGESSEHCFDILSEEELSFESSKLSCKSEEGSYCTSIGPQMINEDHGKLNRSMLSRSLEDLAHLADENHDMTIAMYHDTYQMGLMSLKTPSE